MTNTYRAARPRSRVIELLFAAMLSVLASASLNTALAHDYQLGALKIHHPWMRATPGGAKVAGGFMTITNTGRSPDRLVGGTLTGAGTVEVHEMRIDGDVMRMRMLEKGLEIGPGQTVDLRPGSYHMMFMNLAGGYKEGERIKGTLMFEKAGVVEVDFKVEPIGKGAGEHKH